MKRILIAIILVTLLSVGCSSSTATQASPSTTIQEQVSPSITTQASPTISIQEQISPTTSTQEQTTTGVLIPADNELITIFGETNTIAEIRATEQARIEREGAGLVCGPGMNMLESMMSDPPTEDEAKLLVIMNDLCKKAGQDRK